MSSTSKKKNKRPAGPRAPVVTRAQPAVAHPPKPVVTRQPAAPVVPFDVPEMIKGASAGFTILVLGSAAQPIASHVSAQLGGLWLSLVGALAFAVAGRRVGTSGRPVRQGALAAILSFTLTVPLVLGIKHTLAPLPTAVTLVFAVVVGGVAGRLSAATKRRAATNS